MALGPEQIAIQRQKILGSLYGKKEGIGSTSADSPQISSLKANPLASALERALEEARRKGPGIPVPVNIHPETE